MKLFQNSLLLAVAVLIIALTAVLANAQTSVLPSTRELLPRGIDELRQAASSKTEFTLDHSMLVLASKLDSGNEDLRRVIAGISGISVHDFRYTPAATFDTQAIESIREEYREAGWKQVMNKNQKNSEQGVTDLWVRLENNAVSNVAILVARSSEVDFFLVSGSISPVDLTHLGGHFGIPKIEGGVEVPNTARR
ncbi:MAG: DUF4252 domain-containing protein [Terriglobales bacterium]